MKCMLRTQHINLKTGFIIRSKERGEGAIDIVDGKAKLDDGDYTEKLTEIFWIRCDNAY